MDHHRHLRNIDAPRSQIGGDHYRDPPGLEVRQHLAAFALAELAVQGLGCDCAFAQFIRHDFGGEFGGDKNQHPIPRVLRQQMAQQAGAHIRIDRDRAVGDCCRSGGSRFHGDAQWLVQHAFGQGLHPRRKGGGKKQVLAARWQLRCNARPLLRKACVEHAIGLVQHQRVHRIDCERMALQQIQQTPGRGHDQVGPPAQGQHLGVDRHATK